MNVPDYVPLDDVRLACAQLGLRDWTELNEPRVTLEEAAIIRDQVGGETQAILVEEFRRGLEVELEHGLQFADANVTNNHPILTGKIVLAHLKEMLDYYLRLEVAELEGDLLKASLGGDETKLARVYARLVNARAALSRSEETARAAASGGT